MQVNTCVDGVKRFTGWGVNEYSVLDTVLPLFSVHRYSPMVLRQLRFSLVNWKSLTDDKDWNNSCSMDSEGERSVKK